MEKQCFVSFIYAYSFTMVFLVYILKLPTLVTGNTKLVEEYYAKNFNFTFVLDFFLFLTYLSISLFFIDYFNIKNFFNKVLMVALITTIISGVFFVYFITSKKTDSFFSKWFHAVSYKAVVYDILLLTFTYTIYQYLYKISKSKTLE